MSAELTFEQKILARQEFTRLAEVLDKIRRVAFDSDQVMIWSEVPQVREVNRAFGTSYKPEHMNWDFIARVAMEHGYSETDARVLDYYNWTDSDILSESPPVPGALGAFSIISQNHETHIVTSRPPYNESITRGWYKFYLPEHPPERIHINSDINLSGDKFKVKTIKGETIEGIFEDSVGQAKLILEQSLAWVFLVSSKPESRELNHPRLIKIPSMIHLRTFLTGNPV